MQITPEDLVTLLREHGQTGCYVQAEDGNGQNGVVLDGWFDLEAVAAAINCKFRGANREA